MDAKGWTPEGLTERIWIETPEAIGDSGAM
jgi:hypothetical protein